MATAHKLDVKNFGLAIGLVSAGGVLFLGLAAGNLGWGIEVVTLLEDVYRGFTPDLIGSIIGAAWAFVDGFIFGSLVAWVYNKLN